MSALAHRALGGATATLLWQGVRIVLQFSSLIVLARLLAPEDYGLLAMVTAITGIGELLRDFGLSIASLQSKTLSAAEKSNLFWLNTLIGAALTVTAFVAAAPIAALYGDTRLVTITQALSVTFLVNGIATQFKAQINRDLRFVALGIVEVIPQALAIAAAIAMAVAIGSYWALVVQVLVSAVLGALLCAFLSRWRPGRYRRDVPVRRFVRFGGALVGTQSLAYLSKNVDSILLGLVSGPSQLGVYNRAYQVVVLPLNQVTAPLSRVAIPVLARLQDRPSVFMKYLTTAQFATVTLTSIAYGAVIGLGEPLIRVLLGDEWVDAVPILQILAVSGIFRSLGQVPYWIFVSLGKTGNQLRLYLVGQPVIVIAIAIGATGGPIGVAIGCSVGYAVFWALNMWWAQRVSALPVGRLAVSGLALVCSCGLPVAAIGAAAVALTESDGAALASGGVLAVAWIAAVMALIPRHRAEVGRLGQLARRRRSAGDEARDRPGDSD